VLNKLCVSGDATSSLEDLEKESLTVEKAHKEQRIHKIPREEQDCCSPLQACGKLTIYLNWVFLT